MTHAAARPPRPAEPDAFQRLQTDAAVQELRRRRQPVIGVTAAAMGVYLASAVMANVVPGLLAIRLAGPVNAGLGLDLLQGVTTLGAAWWYARYAGTRIDPVAEHVRAVIEPLQEESR